MRLWTFLYQSVPCMFKPADAVKPLCSEKVIRYMLVLYLQTLKLQWFSFFFLYTCEMNSFSQKL